MILMEALVKYLCIPIAQMVAIYGLTEVVFKYKWNRDKYIPLVGFTICFLCGFLFYGVLLGLEYKIGLLIGLIQGLWAFIGTKFYFKD